MNTYGFTHCPEYKAKNSLFRSVEDLATLRVFDNVKCWNCQKEYIHTDNKIYARIK